MSRRVLCLLTACCLLLSGCGKQQEAPAVDSVPAMELPSDGIPQEGSSLEDQTSAIPGNGTFSMPYNATYGWDPYTCVGMENRAVMQLIYEGLFTMNSTFQAEYGLCESFAVSEDGLSYDLTIRNASFSNGKQLQPLDVIYSMDQARASELYSGRFADISSYYVSGDNVVTVELYTPNDRLPCLLTFPITASGATGQSAAGTGPFVHSSEEVLTLNSQWWKGAGSLSFQTVTLVSSTSAEDTRDSFEIDRVHFVYNNPNASSAATFHCDYELWNSPGTTMQYIGFNFMDGIFQDESVRKALTHAIDRSSIVETAYHNFADAAVLPVASASDMYVEKLAQEYDFTSSQSAMKELTDTASFWLPEERIRALQNPDEAALETTAEPRKGDAEEDPLKAEAETGDAPEEQTAPGEAGEEGDTKQEETAYNSIVFIVRAGNLSRVTAAKEAAEDLSRAGFTVDFQELENDAYYSALNAGAFDLYYGETVLKPDFDLRELLLPEGELSYGGIGEDSRLRSLLDSAMENVGNRYDLYEYIMEHGYMCPVMFVNNAVFTARGVFSGLSPAPDNLFYQAENIKINSN